MKPLQIEKAQLDLENKKKRIAAREKQLKEKVRKQRLRSLIKMGELVEKANLSDLPHNAIFGALLEIGKQTKNTNSINRWIQIADEATQKEAKTHGQPFAIQFSEPPTKELKDALKSLNFKWNSIRKEYYGISKESSLKEILKSTNAKIEKIA